MKKKTVSYLSYGALIIGVAIGIFALADVYIFNSRLPSEICPVIKDRPFLYTAIVLCCISFILSFFETKDKE